MTAYGGKYLRQLEAKLDEEECTCVFAFFLHTLSAKTLPHPSCFNNAVWLVYEQVAIAALDCRAMDLAVRLVQKIRKRFPKSSRTHRLIVSAACVLILQPCSKHVYVTVQCIHEHVVHMEQTCTLQAITT